MRSQTTFTQIRRIMKLHEDGLSSKEISEAVFITEEAIQRVIDVRFPKKKTRKKKEPALEE